MLQLASQPSAKGPRPWGVDSPKEKLTVLLNAWQMGLLLTLLPLNPFLVCQKTLSEARRTITKPLLSLLFPTHSVSLSCFKFESNKIDYFISIVL